MHTKVQNQSLLSKEKCKNKTKSNLKKCSYSHSHKHSSMPILYFLERFWCLSKFHRLIQTQIQTSLYDSMRFTRKLLQAKLSNFYKGKKTTSLSPGRTVTT